MIVYWHEVTLYGHLRSYSFRVICEIIRSVHELIVMNREQFTQILLLNVSLFAHSRSLNRAFFALHSHTLTMSVYSRRESSYSPGSDSYVVLCRPTCACQRGSARKLVLTFACAATLMEYLRTTMVFCLRNWISLSSFWLSSCYCYVGRKCVGEWGKGSGGRETQEDEL